LSFYRQQQQQQQLVVTAEHSAVAGVEWQAK